MGKIIKPNTVNDVALALLDLLARVELIERSLKIKTLNQQELMPIRSCLKNDLDVVNDGL